MSITFCISCHAGEKSTGLKTRHYKERAGMPFEPQDKPALQDVRGWDVLARNAGLEGGDHAGDGVAEGGAAVEVGLPEALEGVGNVGGGRSAAGVFAGTGGGASGCTAGGAKVQFAARSCIGRGENGAEDFAGGVENQGVPEVARDGFIALAAFADDGVLHGLGD